MPEEELKRIRLEVQRRGITRLCHLTPSRKLGHILSSPEGILSRYRLEQTAPEVLDANDPARLDGYLDYVNCSVEYPNTWYYRRVKERDPLFVDWVALLLRPELLWHPGTLFCPTNAAAQRGALVRGGLEGFLALFAQEVVGARGKKIRRSSQMLPCCPTDDQAEVLIPVSVPRSMIEAVAVGSREQAAKEIARLRLAQVPGILTLRWVVAPDLFTTNWSRLVREGRRPDETPYLPGEGG